MAPPKSTQKKVSGPNRVDSTGLPVWWRPYFEAIAANGGFKVEAARTVGIDRSTPAQYISDHPELAELFETSMQAAMDAASDDLMREAKRRGGEGYEEPVIYQGRMMWKPCAGSDLNGEPANHGEKCPYCGLVFRLGPDGKLVEHPALDEHGKPVPLTVRKHSDTLLMFTLNARGKGTRNTSYTLDLSNLSTEQLQRLAAGEDPIDVLALGKGKR